MSKENTLLGAFHIAISILYIVISGTIGVIFCGKSLLSTGLFDFNPVNVAGAIAAAFLFLFAIVGFISGTAMMLNQKWAKIPVLILGCINLISIPLGTTLGVYTIWVYMHDEKKQKKTTEIVNRPVKVVSNDHEEIGYHFSLLRKGVK